MSTSKATKRRSTEELNAHILGQVKAGRGQPRPGADIVRALSSVGMDRSCVYTVLKRMVKTGAIKVSGTRGKQTYVIASPMGTAKKAKALQRGRKRVEKAAKRLLASPTHRRGTTAADEEPLLDETLAGRLARVSNEIGYLEAKVSSLRIEQRDLLNQLDG